MGHSPDLLDRIIASFIRDHKKFIFFVPDQPGYLVFSRRSGTLITIRIEDEVRLECFLYTIGVRVKDVAVAQLLVVVAAEDDDFIRANLRN